MPFKRRSGKFAQGRCKARQGHTEWTTEDYHILYSERVKVPPTGWADISEKTNGRHIQSQCVKEWQDKYRDMTELESRTDKASLRAKRAAEEVRTANKDKRLEKVESTKKPEPSKKRKRADNKEEEDDESEPEEPEEPVRMTRSQALERSKAASQEAEDQDP